LRRRAAGGRWSSPLWVWMLTLISLRVADILRLRGIVPVCIRLTALEQLQTRLDVDVVGV